MDKIIKFIQFRNNTDLPIMIDAPIGEYNKLHSIRIKPYERLIIESNFGEWYMSTMFESYEDIKLWEEKGLGIIANNIINIGIFRSSQPCNSNEYSWIVNRDIFECVYHKINKNDSNGYITFSYK